MHNDHIYFNAINQIPQIGARRFKKLLKYFETMQEAWECSSAEFLKAGLDEKTITNFFEQRKKISPKKEWEKLVNEDIRFLTIQDEDYPKKLKELYDAPACLYVRGEIKNTDDFALAVVGTRKISNYGKQVTPELSYALAQQGITIISGLALGVDAVAHASAMRAEKGRTIAVLGGGVDNRSIYPRQNFQLAEKIIQEQRGAVISEYALGTTPRPENFPQRNRIISGLSLATLVIEAPEDSGALLTARCALEQNRDVFAVPGSIYNLNSIGPNNLIKMGAKLVVSAQDILEELNLEKIEEFTKVRKIVPDTREEAEILKHLSREPLHIDKLVALTNLDSQSINSVLSLMEMKGKVKNLGGMQYVVCG